ncbi:hypothetical protein TNCV_661431 [Trichonephila clavipes]|nr:hypothetical protein TNCV_661431 [Trichonephila clavipes]
MAPSQTLQLKPSNIDANVAVQHPARHEYATFVLAGCVLNLYQHPVKTIVLAGWLAYLHFIRTFGTEGTQNEPSFDRYKKRGPAILVSTCAMEKCIFL